MFIISKLIIINCIEMGDTDINNKVLYGFKYCIQNGLGADLVRLTGLLNLCEIRGTVLYFDPNDIWDHVPKNSPDRSWTYYFEPTIPIATSNNLPRIDMKNYNMTIIPETKKHFNKFQYRSDLMKKIYVPKQEFISIVKNHIQQNLPDLLKNEYGLIHIRRGDKVTGPWRETQIIQIDRYLDELKKWLNNNPQNNTFNVYIMTDNDDVIKEIQSKQEEHTLLGIKFIWDNTEIRRDGYSYKLYKHGYSDDEKVNEMITNMKNLWLMEHAKVMIGARSSFLFITGELLNGNPGISLENNNRYPTDL